MGRVPACPYPCGWDGLHKIAVADGAYMASIEWTEDEEGISVQCAVAMRTVTNLIGVCRAMRANSPKASTPRAAGNESAATSEHPSPTLTSPPSKRAFLRMDHYDHPPHKAGDR